MKRMLFVLSAILLLSSAGCADRADDVRTESRESVESEPNMDDLYPRSEEDFEGRLKKDLESAAPLLPLDRARDADSRSNDGVIDELRQKAENGSGYDKRTYGLVCYFGSGYVGIEEVKQDYEEAVKWFRKGAEAGDSKSMFMLGKCYSSGKGVEKDIKEAEKWYRQAAEAGDEEAEDALEDLVSGNEDDVEESFEQLLKDAEAGDTDAMVSVAGYFSMGDGVDQNFSESAKWELKAAEGGNVLGMVLYGSACLFGRGVEKDEKEGAKWMRKAADAGDLDAEYLLGVCYLGGMGVERNISKGLELIKDAADHGCDSAVQFRDDNPTLFK